MIYTLFFCLVSYLHAQDLVVKTISDTADYQVSEDPLLQSITEADRHWVIPKRPDNSGLPQNGRIYLPSIPVDLKGPGKLERVVNKQDGRERVKQYSKWPHSCIVKLHLFGSQISQQIESGGTGVMVGPQHVLTAAHNIYSIGQWTQKIVAIPAYDNGTVPFDEAIATQFYVFPQWISQSENKNYDLALIILDRPIGRMTGWMGLMSLSDLNLKHQEINVTGYPGDRDSAKVMYTMKDKIYRLQQERMFYQIDTNSGQSGSPVWGYKDGVPYVFGIHAYGYETLGDGNSGTRITAEKIKMLVSKGLEKTWHIVTSPDPTITDPQEREEKGLECYKQGNIRHAILWLTLAARRNRPIAQYYLGLCYSSEHAPRKDLDEAFKCFQKAAVEHELPDAIYKLGLCYLDGTPEKSETMAANLFRKGSELGHLPCRNRWTQCLYDGIGIQEDKRAAERLMQLQSSTPNNSMYQEQAQRKSGSIENPSVQSSAIKEPEQPLSRSIVFLTQNHDEPIINKLESFDTINTLIDKEILNNPKNCKNFDLRNKKIDDNAAKKLEEILTKMHNLEKIFLGNNQISFAGMKSIVSGLMKTNLKQLRWHDNENCDAGIVFQILDIKTLKECEFYNMRLDQDFLNKFGKFISQWDQLTDLSFNNCHISDIHLVILAKFLINVPTLKRLYLKNNKLKGDNVNNFVQILKKNPNIEYLYLQGNDITDIAKKALKVFNKRIYY